MNTNLSLSARVKRRNAAGFKGQGSSSFVKSTPCGDYRNILDNHKDMSMNPYHQNLVNFSKKRGTRHAGSKKMSTLKQHI